VFSARVYAAATPLPYTPAVRRIPLILAIVALVGGLGLIATVYFTKPAPAHNAAFTGGASPSSVPSSAAPAPSAVASPPPPQAGGVPKTTAYRFPVLGNASYAHTHHDYPASDIMSACGNTVVSPVNGVVLEVTLVDTWSAKVNAGATRGGLSWSILGDDGIRYYGSHLSVVDVRAGVRVKAGQKVGRVGKTGDTTACHVHFGISPVCQKTGDWWIRRGVIYPWSYLDAWRRGVAKSPVAAIKAWQAENGCPKKPLVDP
jgi:peptidoglycan LD-endopeptidase LytH